MSVHAGIDIGTSGVKVVLMEDCRRLLAEASQAITVDVAQIGWSEQDPDLWVSAVFSCLDRLAADAPGPLSAVEGLGLSGQMLAALLLDRDLRPVRPAMLWNDQRATAECAELLARCPDISQRSNGAPDPGITAPKLLWLARHEPETLARARMLLLPKDYVRLALTGDLASEPTDAGGTQLFDCLHAVWDDAFCRAAGWPIDQLPPLVQPWQEAGQLRSDLARRWGMRAGLVVAAGAGDNMAATIGVGAARPGEAVLTIGTSGVACLVDAGFHPAPHAAVLTSAHAAPDSFLSMGVVMSATASLDWAARMTGSDSGTLAREAESFAETGRIDQAPVFLPSLKGIRTPLNRPEATGRIHGLHPGTDRAMLGYATMEGVAFQFADCVAAQRAAGVAAHRFAAVGGGTRSRLWTRLLATSLNEPLALPANAAISAPGGAARLGAVASGAGAPLDIIGAGMTREGEDEPVIEPCPRLAGILAERLKAFHALLPQA